MRLKPIIHRFASCPSTNDVVRGMAADGAPEGTVVVAEEQTAGRGTKGRSWYSAPDKGLYLSILLRPGPEKVSLLPILAGLAAREAILRACGLRAGLRWPNDLVWRGKKLGGVLCETAFSGNRLEFVLLGIGLNLNHEESDFPSDIRGGAVSVRMAILHPVDGDSILQGLLESLANWYDIYGRREWKAMIRSFEQASAFRKGKKLQVRLNQEVFSGAFQGLDDDGYLVLRDASGVRHFSSAEVVGVL